MMINFSESGHPYFVDPVLWNEELCEAKEKETCLHDEDTAEVVLRTIISVSQRTCATNWPGESLVVQNVEGNLLLRTIRRPW